LVTKTCYSHKAGTAANSLVNVFNRIVEEKGRQLSYVIPISDNGGSSSELIRVIGGPSTSFFQSSHNLQY
jgi:hypothetical protein